MNEYDICWEKGLYLDGIDCRLCPYCNECSGADMEDDD